jgi:D-methionine transport system ATP-binding protein
MIKIENLTKTYTTSAGAITGIQGINLTVRKGEIFGVIGKSGAGKSTLIHCLNLLTKPDSGIIKINNIEINSLSGAALRVERRKIGMIFQHFNLLSSRTVFDNIALPLKLTGIANNKIKQRVDELLELVGLSDKADIYPAKLSGGQKQRVAIARALANKPDVLLCDEATSALDPHTTQTILKLLKDIQRKLGLTILLITHEMNVIKQICDRVAVMDQGKIIEQGDVLAVFTEPKEPITRDLIGTALKLDLPSDISEALQHKWRPEAQTLLRFTFVGKRATNPVLSELTRKLHIDFNILQANIELIHGEPVGIMLVQTQATEAQLQQILNYTQEQHVKLEVLGHVH